MSKDLAAIIGGGRALGNIIPSFLLIMFMIFVSISIFVMIMFASVVEDSGFSDCRRREHYGYKTHGNKLFQFYLQISDDGDQKEEHKQGCQ